jgi:hypothetical protein
MYRIGQNLISDPRKSAGKHALCVEVSKEFPMSQSRTDYPAGFYVKGKIEWHHFKMVRLVKLKDGSFLFPVPSDIRKKLNKQAGDPIRIDITKDRLYWGMDEKLMMAMYHEPEMHQVAKSFNCMLPKMQQHRYHEWIGTARSEEERLDRIVATLEAWNNKLTFKQMKEVQRQKRQGFT